MMIKTLRATAKSQRVRESKITQEFSVEQKNEINNGNKTQGEKIK